MPQSLPYVFDTTRTGRILCTVLLASAFFILPLLSALLYFALEKQDVLVCLAPVFVGLLDIPVALFLFKKLGGVQGSISSREVIVKADNFLGISSGAPSGSFGLNQFQCLRLTNAQSREYSLYKLSLIGRDNTPNIQFYCAPQDRAQIFAADLAAAINIPLEPLQNKT
jgi:hypothetical protein